MAAQLDDQELRRVAAMWADIARHQLVRFENAVDAYAAAHADYAFRASVHSRGGPTPEWASHYAEANRYLTHHQVWNVGAERYFLLLALAQLRKCVLRLPSDELPALREHKVVKLLRDIDEHWEQRDENRSLTELREWKPYLEPAPGQFWFNGKHIWLGDASLTEINAWIQNVDRAVRDRSKTAGSPIPKPGDRLPGRDVGPCLE